MGISIRFLPLFSISSAVLSFLAKFRPFALSSGVDRGVCVIDHDVAPPARSRFVLNFNRPSLVVAPPTHERDEANRTHAVRTLHSFSFFLSLFLSVPFFLYVYIYRDSPDTINNRLHTPAVSLSL